MGDKPWWSHFVTTLRDDWSAIMVTLICLAAGLSIFVDKPTTITHAVSPVVQDVWTAFIVGGALVRLVWHFYRRLDVLRAVGGIAIAVGSYVYLAALFLSPTASWFICIILIMPTFQGIDRARSDRRIRKSNEELRALAKTLEKRTYYVDE